MTIKESESPEMGMVAMMAETEETKRVTNATVEGRVWVLSEWDSDAVDSWVRGIFSCAQNAMDYAGVQKELWIDHRYDDPCGYRGFVISERDLDPVME